MSSPSHISQKEIHDLTSSIIHLTVWSIGTVGHLFWELFMPGAETQPVPIHLFPNVLIFTEAIKKLLCLAGVGGRNNLKFWNWNAAALNKLRYLRLMKLPLSKGKNEIRATEYFFFLKITISQKLWQQKKHNIEYS